MKRWFMLAGAVSFGFVFQNCGDMVNNEVHELEQKSTSHPYDILKFLAEGADQVVKARQGLDGSSESPLKFSNGNDGGAIVAEFQITDPAVAGQFKISKANCRYTTEAADDYSLGPSGVTLPEGVDLGEMSAQSSTKWITDCELVTTMGVVNYHGEGSTGDSLHLGGISQLSRSKHRLQMQDGSVHEIDHIVKRYSLYGPTQDTSRIYQQATWNGKPANPIKASQFDAGFLLQGS